MTADRDRLSDTSRTGKGQSSRESFMHPIREYPESEAEHDSHTGQGAVADPVPDMPNPTRRSRPNGQY